MKKLLYIIIILQIITFAKGQKVEVNWGKFSPKIFEQSRKENNIIKLEGKLVPLVPCNGRFDLFEF